MRKPDEDAEKACRQIFGNDLINEVIKEKEKDANTNDVADDVIDDVINPDQVPDVEERLKRNPFDLFDAEEDYYRRCFRACDANDSGV